MSISAADISPFHLTAVDASFIGSNDLGNFPSTAGYLGMFLSLADGSVVEANVALPGFAGGSFSFGRYNFGSSITSLDLIAVDFYAYNCNGSGTCTRFNSNKGQFALDNVVLTSEVTAVPEPDTYAMMLLGLAGVGAMARRRQRRAQAGAGQAIPVVQTDRGGEVTYHGPGQVVIYVLMDLRRNKPGGKLYARQFVTKIEQAVIDVLAAYNLAGERIAGAPGIYMADGAKSIATFSDTP